MSRITRPALALAAALGAAAPPARAQEAPPAPPPPAAAAKPEEPRAAPEKPLARVELADGTIVLGDLHVAEFRIKTPYGPLVVPAADVIALRSGRGSDPDLKPRIRKLIERLGSDSFREREQAEAELGRLGGLALPEVRKAAESEDPEIRARALQILESAPVGSDEDESPELDEIVTPHFTARGTLDLEELRVTTRFGSLVVPRRDLRLLRVREPDVLRKSINVTAASAVQGLVRVGLRVRRGDKVSIEAIGTLKMRGGRPIPPEGSDEFGMGTWPGVAGNLTAKFGALVARIGSETLITGSRWSGPAPDDGEVELGVAAHPGMLGEASGGYRVTISVIPASR